MHALRATLVPASLYSMRLPYTHQSALTYPLPPPSTIFGLLANALQRAEERPPLDCLSDVEAGVRLAAATCDGLIATRSCIVSLVTKLEGEGKKTNALPRQFAHTAALDIYALGEDIALLERCAAALRRAPVSLGDSESPATVTAAAISPCAVTHATQGQEVLTGGYIRQNLVRQVRGQNALFWCHETCRDARDLHGYLFPLRLVGHTFEPSPVQAVLAAEALRYEVGTVRLFAPAA